MKTTKAITLGMGDIIQNTDGEYFEISTAYTDPHNIKQISAFSLINGRRKNFEVSIESTVAVFTREDYDEISAEPVTA